MNYNFNEYKNGVLSFVNDTKSWNSLDKYKFYTTCGELVSKDWEETTDNANGGLDISWAFHKKNITEDEILTHFYKEIINILNANIDNCTEIENIQFNY